MKLSELFEQTVKSLHTQNITFAVAGGWAAGLYRNEPRVTGDVDFVIASDANEDEMAERILHQLELTPKKVRKADLDGGPLFAIKKKNTPVMIIGGREEKNEFGIGVDFLLPSLPWVLSALKRAADNQFDFGFGPIPVLTIEDVIISKLYAFQSTLNRHKDLDDLFSIFESKPDLDNLYLRLQIENLDLKLSKDKKQNIPQPLQDLFV